MAIRTAKGTIADKLSSTTLVLPNVTIDSNAGLFVGVGFDQSQGAPVVTFGDVTLQKLRQRLSAVSGIGVALYSKPQVWNGGTRNITATWPGAIEAKAMFASQIVGASVEDVGANNLQDTATTTPNSLLTGLPNYDNAFAFGAHVSKGPEGDTPGTPEATYGYTAGQRVGTTGGDPTTNVTIQETFLDMPTALDTRSRLTGATSRSWASSLTVIRKHTQNAQAISPTDVGLIVEKFESLGLDANNIVLAFNEGLDRWEAFDVARGGLPSPIAHSNNNWI